MDEERLKRTLQSIGMETFAKYYEAFADETIESDALVDALMKVEGYAEASAKIKVTSSRRLFAGKGELGALRLITASSRVPAWVVEKARYLIAGERES